MAIYSNYSRTQRYAAGDIVNVSGTLWRAVVANAGVIPGTDFRVWTVASTIQSSVISNANTSIARQTDGGATGGRPGWPTWGANPCDWLESQPSKPSGQNAPIGIDDRMRPYVDDDGLYPASRDPRLPSFFPYMPTNLENWPTACPKNVYPGVEGGWFGIGGDDPHPPLGGGYGGSVWPASGPFDQQVDKETGYWAQKIQRFFNSPIVRFLVDEEQRSKVIRYLLQGNYPLLLYILFDPRCRSLWIEFFEEWDVVLPDYTRLAEILWQLVLELMYHPYYGPLVRRLWKELTTGRDDDMPIRWPTTSPKPEDWEGRWPPPVSPELIDEELCRRWREEQDDEPEVNPSGWELPADNGPTRYRKDDFKLPREYKPCPERFISSVTPPSSATPPI